MYATLHIKPGQMPRLIHGWDTAAIGRELDVPLLEGNAARDEEVIGAIKSRRAVTRILATRGLPPLYLDLRCRTMTTTFSR